MSVRGAIVCLSLLLLAACGGGSSSDDSAQPAPPLRGSRSSDTITSSHTGTSYALSVYRPPAGAGPAATLPVVYALDGESWFETLVGIAEASAVPFIVVAINGAGQRNRDFVPPNSCTAGGGGHAQYLDFLRSELVPHIERTVGGSATRRVLFGHSHGGSFALFALFAEAAPSRTFAAYLPSDASIACMPVYAYGWEQAYGEAHRDLPVRLHLSYATLGNLPANEAFARHIGTRGYQGLSFEPRMYTGTHGGIVPQALADGLRFALAP